MTALSTYWCRQRLQRVQTENAKNGFLKIPLNDYLVQDVDVLIEKFRDK